MDNQGTLFYSAPDSCVDLMMEIHGLLCSSDITDDGGIDDLITDEIDWGV